VAQTDANPIANAPQIAISAGQAGAAAPQTVVPPVTLSSSPATIHDWWAEWTHGIGGRKPASQFRTRDKQAANRSTFLRRNNVWQIIKRPVDAGIDADVAYDHFYLCMPLMQRCSKQRANCFASKHLFILLF
jgi:Transcriptional activator of glycolytic enzymes